MADKQVRDVVVHVTEGDDLEARRERVHAFHVAVIAERLEQSRLSVAEKLAVVAQIEDLLKERLLP